MKYYYQGQEEENANEVSEREALRFLENAGYSDPKYCLENLDRLFKGWRRLQFGTLMTEKALNQ